MREFSQDLAAFRKEIAAWLDENCPDEMRQPVRGDDDICWGGRNFTFQSPAQRTWMTRAAEVGLTVPTWPVAYGGAGLDRAREKVLIEEMERIGARPPLQSFGIWMLGPALLAFGSEAQKAQYLPPIARGEIRWCQGYSEPGAGSDLAGVQTKGVREGDGYTVNGQKIWTSYADKADWIFALIRTEPDAPKHKGISFMLIDMTSKGVSTKPIRLISGASPFCETFFDDVAVPADQIVGAPGEGWTIAKYLLTHEREMISGGGGGLLGGATLAGQIPADASPSLRARAAMAEVDTIAMGLTLERYKDKAESGGGVGDASAMLKYMGTELNKHRYELMVEAAGTQALSWKGGLASDWLRTKANSIEGGTSEVMLSIISKRILGLPG